MNRSEVIGKLEALLHRVRTRAVRVQPPPAAPSSVAVESAVAVAQAAPAPHPRPIEEPPAPQGVVTLPPPAHITEPPDEAPEVAVAASDGEDVAVVWGETTLLESDSELEALEGHDSRERLVAAEPTAFESSPPEASAPEPAPVEGFAAEEPATDSISVESIPADSIPIASMAGEPAPGEPSVVVQRSEPPMDVTELDLVSTEEEPPISSRRVVASEPEERLAEMAFGAEEPAVPLHTPPPESGRLPSAPVNEFDPETDPAESGRLRAGPAMPGDFEPDPDVTGVRSATPLLPLRSPPPVRELAPEVTRVVRQPNDAVADVVAAAQAFAPRTFVALLDASLSL